MIIEITRGDDPVGLVSYLMGNTQELRHGAELVALEYLATIETAPAEMRSVYEQSERCRSPILHVSIALSPGETLTATEWEEAWTQVDRLLQMESHQKVTVAHHEKDHQHQHRGYNIISPETFATPKARPWSKVERRFLDEWELPDIAGPTERRSWDTNLKFRLQQLARKLEALFGLCNAAAPDRWASNARGEDRASSGAKKREERTGTTPIIERCGKEMRQALRKASWAEREAELARLGIGIREYCGKNRHRQGIVFFDLNEPGNAIAGSELGSDYARGALEKSADQSFAAFLGSKTPQVRPSGPVSTPRQDPLYDAFKAYQEELRHAQIIWTEAYERLSAELKRNRKMLVDKQRAERRVLLASAATHNRMQMRDLLESRYRKEHEQLTAAQWEQRRYLRNLKPKALNWRAWLEAEAALGNAQARKLLVRQPVARNQTPKRPFNFGMDAGRF